MTREPFGRADSIGSVEQLTIRGGGLTARFLTYGAVLRDLRLDGHDAPLVLGLENLGDYLRHSKYFGATAGRCANRIGGSRFRLDDRTWRLDANSAGGHHLHGGRDGTGVRNWTVAGHDASRLVLATELADGHMGYPGRISIEAEFSLGADAELDIRYRAHSDAATICNLAHHSYWNLTGGSDLSGHTMVVPAERMTLVDADLIPTGELGPVAGTPYDMRQGADLGAWPAGLLLDHNYCLADTRGPLRRVGELSAPGLAMEILSTEPGLQVYDGAKLDVTVPGLDGRRYGPRAGLAIEPQIWPDAINHPHFPSPVLRPGDDYFQHTRFAFRRR